MILENLVEILFDLIQKNIKKTYYELILLLKSNESNPQTTNKAQAGRRQGLNIFL